MTKEELLLEREQLKTAIQNSLEGGAEFETRDGRVRQVDIDKMYKRLNEIDRALTAMGGFNRNTTLLRYGGVY